jgi:hypothetical protein
VALTGSNKTGDLLQQQQQQRRQQQQQGKLISLPGISKGNAGFSSLASDEAETT